ncbi:DUF4282 domain-containing protein [Endozoicomonas sp. SESOKO1]|uniref:DUF4282 domain-containing protein n=1 Tax=Endozoicomonas sp. SESOKO1 TaxID=2828742 RepID=UPI00214924EF|nr:DUF4282 domain-containing protein [Endozoicomonas sp. SESOKO1]
MEKIAKDIIFFNSMLTPKIITFIYWLMVLGVVVSGFGLMFNKYSGGFFIGLGTILGGLVTTRIFCELLIVIFKIHSNLDKIANK